MADKLKFQEKLSGILHLAEEKQMHLNIEEIEKFFEEEALSAQQIELVCDYLLSQKVAVSGYRKKARSDSAGGGRKRGADPGRTGIPGKLS